MRSFLGSSRSWFPSSGMRQIIFYGELSSVLAKGGRGTEHRTPHGEEETRGGGEGHPHLPGREPLLHALALCPVERKMGGKMECKEK